VDVVPQVVVGGDSKSSGQNLMEGLLAILLSEKLGGTVGAGLGATRPEVDAMRQQILQRLMAESPDIKGTPTTPLAGNGADRKA
jgi:hypothetical protein